MIISRSSWFSEQSNSDKNITKWLKWLFFLFSPEAEEAALDKGTFLPHRELIFQERIAMNKLLTVKIFSFVLAYNYVSLSNIWACLCAQQLSAAVIAQVNYLHWKPEYTSFPALCTRNTPCLAFLPPGSRNNSELPEKTILILERGRRRKHVLWCRVAHTHTHGAHGSGLYPSSEKTCSSFEWGLTSADWLECHSSTREHELSPALHYPTASPAFPYPFGIRFRIQ